jgi:hypothetical protein
MRFTIIRTTLLTALVCGVAGAAVLAVAADYPSQSQVYERPPAEYYAAAPDGPAPGRTQDGSAGEWYPDGPAAGSRASDEGGGFLNRVCGPCDGGPRWTFDGGLLMLKRASTGSEPLFLDDATYPAVSTTSGDLDMPLTLGFQLSAVRHNVFGSCFDVEVGYFQVDWAANSSAQQLPVRDGSVDMIYGNDGGPQTFVVDSGASIRYTSGLHLGEINLRHEVFDGLTLLAGFRMGELDEHYSVNGYNSLVGVGPTTLDIRTFNHLYGFQVGADAELFDACQPFQMHVLCKAGVYGNSASQTNNVTDAPSATNEMLGATGNQTAFMGETGIIMSYRVNCHLTFRATATATWLQGLALAPQQVGTTDFVVNNVATVDTGSGIFYYGGGLGCEVKF